jgi:hypothetical protein
VVGAGRGRKVRRAAVRLVGRRAARQSCPGAPGPTKVAANGHRPGQNRARFAA